MNFSATQIANFRDCPRKWYLKSIKKVEGPQNAYAALGSFIHEVLEKYLSTGELPRGREKVFEIPGKKEYSGDNIIDIILPVIPYLPKPGVASVEEEISMNLGDLGTMRGFIDAQYIDIDNVPVVHDHKTTSDVKWALTTEGLAQDVQAVIYSVYAIEKLQVDRVRCRWGYIQTNKPKVKIISYDFLLTDLDKLWHNVILDCTEMKRLAGVSIEQVPYEAGSCEKYGGCPYRGDACKLTVAERLKGIRTMISLKERMQQRQQTAQAPKVEVNPPEAVSPENALARIKARQEAKIAIDAPKAAPEAKAAPEEKEKAKAKVEAKPAIIKSKPAIAKGYTLYIGCAPQGEYIEFSKIGSIVNATIETERGAVYRLLPDMYGGAPALFAKTVGDYLALNPQSAIVVDPNTEMGRDALDVLIEKAASIVRRF